MTLAEAGVWLGLLPIAIYALTFAPYAFLKQGAVEPTGLIALHQRMLTLQEEVLPHHTYQSVWYEWALNWRAIWYFYEPYDGAQRGVLLLNAVLTVEEGRAGAHQGKGWEGFTDHAIETLAREREGLVFLLWGSYAQAKGKVIDTRRHRVLRAPHPSPLSAHRGFLGCGHFSATNHYLAQRGQAPIDWRLPPRDQLVL